MAASKSVNFSSLPTFSPSLLFLAVGSSGFLILLQHCFYIALLHAFVQFPYLLTQQLIFSFEEADLLILMQQFLLHVCQLAVLAVNDTIEFIYLIALSPIFLIFNIAKLLSLLMSVVLFELYLQLIDFEFLFNSGPVEFCIFLLVKLLCLIGEQHFVFENGIIDEQRVVFGTKSVEIVLAGRAATAIMHYYSKKQ